MRHAESIVVVLLDDLIRGGTVGYIYFTIGIEICKRYPGIA